MWDSGGWKIGGVSCAKTGCHRPTGCSTVSWAVEIALASLQHRLAADRKRWAADRSLGCQRKSLETLASTLAPASWTAEGLRRVGSHPPWAERLPTRRELHRHPNCRFWTNTGSSLGGRRSSTRDSCTSRGFGPFPSPLSVVPGGVIDSSCPCYHPAGSPWFPKSWREVTTPPRRHST